MKRCPMNRYTVWSSKFSKIEEYVTDSHTNTYRDLNPRRTNGNWLHQHFTAEDMISWGYYIYKGKILPEWVA